MNSQLRSHIYFLFFSSIVLLILITSAIRLLPVKPYVRLYSLSIGHIVSRIAPRDAAANATLGVSNTLCLVPILRFTYYLGLLTLNLPVPKALGDLGWTELAHAWTRGCG